MMTPIFLSHNLQSGTQLQPCPTHSLGQLSPVLLVPSTSIPSSGLELSVHYPFVHPSSLVLSCCPVPFTLRSLSPSTLLTSPPVRPGTQLADSLIRRPSILCRPLCWANLMLVDHKAYCFQSAYTIITGSSEREQCPGDECGEAS